VVFSDLSLGAWLPHQIAAEWAAGCGLPPYPAGWQGDSVGGRAELNFGAVADAGIEMEAAGERVVRDAARLAERLAARLLEPGAPGLLAVLAPRAGRPWREENLAFLRFILPALETAGARLCLLACFGEADANGASAAGLQAPEGFALHWRPAPPSMLPAERPPADGIALLPGLVPASLARSPCRSLGLALPHGFILPAPERRPIAAPAPGVYDRLRPALSGHPWLQAYAEFAGSNYHVDAGSLARHATAAFDHGSTEIAIDYLQRAISCARGIRRAGLQCQLQGYRIATHRFDEAAREEGPGRNLPAKVAAFLSMARGWGAVMSGSAQRGIADLRQAAAGLGDDPDQKFKSYLRNITALGLAQLGALDEAMAQEEIVARQNGAEDRSWPLHYVNHVNMARLHRRQGNFAEARRHYDEAFASHWGGRSTSDRVYTNAVMARMAEAAGQPAILHWVRSALHFAASLVPEAFGARHASVIAGAQARLGSREDRVDAVADALASIVEAARPAVPAAATASLPVFTERPLDPARASGARLIGAPGWSLVADAAPGVPAFDSPAMRRLRRALAVWLSGSCGFGEDGGGTFHVDCRLGREIAATPEEVLETAVRLNVPTISLRGRPLRLGQDRLRSLGEACRLELSTLVCAVARQGEEVSIRFKRGRPPFRFCDTLGIIAAARRGEGVGEVVAGRPHGLSPAQVQGEIERVERAGVIWRRLPPESARC
jgi:tetratricopeptide (TPR) repeat protein